MATVKQLIEDLFSHELTGSKWHTYSVDGIIQLIEEKAKEKKISEMDAHYVLLMRSLKKSTKAREAIFILSNNLLGGPGD